VKGRAVAARAVALAVAVAAMAGCAAMKPADPRLAQARAAREALFQDNLATYRTTGPEEAAALDLLRRFKRAHDTFDARALEALLALSFEARHYPARDSAEVQTRDAYVEARRRWTARPGPGRDLVIAIQGSHLSPNTGQLALTALTTHRSKHFAPRYLESFVFGREGGEWKLRRIMTYPMRPPSPTLYEARVLFTEMQGLSQPTPEAIVRTMRAEGPDSVFDRHYPLGSTARSGVRSVGSAGPFVVIFREPPPEGARIEIQEQAYGPVSERAGGTVVVRAPVSPFFYIVSTDKWWGFGYTVVVRVLLDGVSIAEETLTLQ